MNWRAVGGFWLLVLGIAAFAGLIVLGVYLWHWWFAAAFLVALAIFASVMVGTNVHKR